MDIVLTDIVADTETQTVTKIKRPQNYHVVFLNDDFTPMNFVVKILEEFFHRSREESLAIMLEVHHYGKGIAGTYNKEIAEQKSQEANEIADLNNYPLKTKTMPAGDGDSDT